MPLYEHVVIARQEISAQQMDALVENLKSIIVAAGGRVPKTEYWGLRTLAYRIKKNRKGHYALLNIDAPHEAVAEMERQMRINDDILRFMTIRVDELESGDSAMMRNRGGRDDRRGRGDRGHRGERSERPPSKPAASPNDAAPASEGEGQ